MELHSLVNAGALGIFLLWLLLSLFILALMALLPLLALLQRQSAPGGDTGRQQHGRV